MHWIGVLFMGLIQSLIIFFTQYFTKRVAIGAAVIAAFTLIVVAFTAAIDGLISQVGSLAPPVVVAGFGGLLPGNLGTCLGLILASHVAAITFRMKGYLLQMFSLKGGV